MFHCFFHLIYREVMNYYKYFINLIIVSIKFKFIWLLFILFVYISFIS